MTRRSGAPASAAAVAIMVVENKRETERTTTKEALDAFLPYVGLTLFWRKHDYCQNNTTAKPDVHLFLCAGLVCVWGGLSQRILVGVRAFRVRLRGETELLTHFVNHS